MASLFQNIVSLSTWLRAGSKSKVADVGEDGRWDCHRAVSSGLVDERTVRDVALDRLHLTAVHRRVVALRSQQ